MDTFEAVAKYAPQFLPILASLGVILFARNYLFRDMISTDLYKAQIEREREIIRVQEEVSVSMVEIVKQLEHLTKKVSEEIKDSNGRITGLERFLSDQIETMHILSDNIQKLAWQCEKHRKDIPDTQVFRKERP